MRTFWMSFLLPLAVVLLAAFSRFIPHPPNFTPMLAIALFSGWVVPSRFWAYVIPVLAMLISDLALGVHSLMGIVYLSLIPSVWMGMSIRTVDRQPGLLQQSFGWLVRVLGSAVVFFVITNLAVWWTSGMYPQTSEGLVTCFTLALPFFHNSLVSTGLYLFIMLAGWSMLPQSSGVVAEVKQG